MDSDSKPRLRHCTIVDEPESNVSKMIIGKSFYDITRTGSREKFLHLKSMLDGRHNLDEIATISGVKIEAVEDIVDSFSSLGLFQNRECFELVPKEYFLQRVEESSLMWRRQIDLHPLFGKLIDGECRKEVFIGYLIEGYQYVKMLPKVLLRASEVIEDKNIRSVVENYAAEELNHYRIYESELKKLPRIGKWIADSHPTSGTLALVRSFEAIARHSDLSLIACIQLIEARESEVADAEDHLKTISKHFGMESFVEPYLEHMNADIGLGHSNLLADALVNWSHVPADTAHIAVNDMHDIKHSFDIYHDSILEYYSDISNYLPRLKVDFFAL